MECFIKKIWQDRADEEVHKQFIRFGKGAFPGRAVLNLQRGEKIKIRGSFEWANDFIKIVSEINPDAIFSGIILSKEELSFSGKKKGVIFEYDVENIESKKIKEIKDKTYYVLLDAQTKDNSLILKMKKKLPKPGKSGESKIDDKFCQLEADLKYWQAIKEFFMLPDCKKCKILHTFIIEEIVFPRDEKDPEKIRLLAKRKGKIIRSSEIDKQERKEEKEFVA